MSATDFLPRNLPPEARQLSLLAIAKQNRERYEDLKTSPVLAAALGFTPEMFELVDRQLAAGDAEDAAKAKAKWYLEPSVAAGLRAECLKGNLDACESLFDGSVTSSPCWKNPVVQTIRKRIEREYRQKLARHNESVQRDREEMVVTTGQEAFVPDRLKREANQKLILEVYDPYCAAQYKATPKSPGGSIVQAVKEEKSNTLLYVLLGAAAVGGIYFYMRRR